MDRFQGGRFQFKEGWKGIDKTGRTWDVLTDSITASKAGVKLLNDAMAVIRM